MTSLGALTKLAGRASGGMPPEEAVQRALPLLQDGLSAREVQLVYGSEDSFRSFGAPASQGLSDVALWLINYDLTSRAAPCAIAFSLAEATTYSPWRKVLSRHSIRTFGVDDATSSLHLHPHCDDASASAV